MRRVQQLEATDGRLPELGEGNPPVEVGVRGRNRLRDIEERIASATLKGAANPELRLVFSPALPARFLRATAGRRDS